jgi:hypothetical protein
MNTTRLKQARRLFVHQDVDASTARHNIRQWARSLAFLRHESKRAWLLAGNVEKL